MATRNDNTESTHQKKMNLLHHCVGLSIHTCENDEIRTVVNFVKFPNLISFSFKNIHNFGLKLKFQYGLNSKNMLELWTDGRGMSVFYYDKYGLLCRTQPQLHAYIYTNTQ